MDLGEEIKRFRVEPIPATETEEAPAEPETRPAPVEEDA